ncbi:MAG: polymerase [Spirochaetales bacterium]|nr:MAG: polymerase [Spirochaetales bacterium]
MIGLDNFRERMKAEAEKTRKIKSVQVGGRSLDDALRQASLELGLPLRVLEYEILDRGHGGVLGRKSRPWRIIAYESVNLKADKNEQSLEDELGLKAYEVQEVPEDIDADGRFSVRLAANGAWLKVFPPEGKGRPVFPEEVIIVNEPGPGGVDLRVEDIRGFLTNNSVIYGVLDEALQDFEDFPEYGVSYLVAEGSPPVNGSDARVIYNFETDPNKISIKEREDGSVDFKELNRYQNVVKGQPLARKIPPEPGKDGRTVYGRYIPARDGNDLEIGLGKNVTITDNGATVIATASGHVMIKNGKINVDTVLVIPGNVDARTGHVNTLGSVVIRGNVEDGYNVTAQGKIEVLGYVGKANLNAGGDIVVSRGINGGEGTEFGHIVAAKSIWSSFIQYAQAEAGEYVIVSAGIVNSDVVAQKRILCKGRRAKIVGGHVRASEEVNAITLGSPGSSETLVEVGFDPRAREELEQLNNQYEALDSEKDTVDLNLQGLKRQVLIQKKRLSKEKEQLFEELRKKHNELHRKMAALQEEINRKQEYLNTLTINGKVSASKRVYAGVKLRIRDVEYVVKDSYESPVTFVLDGDYISTVKYQDIQDELIRR